MLGVAKGTQRFDRRDVGVGVIIGLDQLSKDCGGVATPFREGVQKRQACVGGDVGRIQTNLVEESRFSSVRGALTCVQLARDEAKAGCRLLAETLSLRGLGAFNTLDHRVQIIAQKGSVGQQDVGCDISRACFESSAGVVLGVFRVLGFEGNAGEQGMGRAGIRTQGQLGVAGGIVELAGLEEQLRQTESHVVRTAGQLERLFEGRDGVRVTPEALE